MIFLSLFFLLKSPQMINDIFPIEEWEKHLFNTCGYVYPYDDWKLNEYGLLDDLDGEFVDPDKYTDDDFAQEFYSVPSKEKLSMVRKYFEEVYDSEGFDVNHYPGPTMAEIRPCFPFYRDPKVRDRVWSLARLAMDWYNNTNKTVFTVTKIDKVNYMMKEYNTYFITFAASEKASGQDAVFQAKVMIDLAKEKMRGVNFCRLKPLNEGSKRRRCT